MRKGFKISQYGNLAETLLAKGTPDAISLICGTRRTSYRELHAMVRGCSSRLRAMGLQPGDRVGLCSRNSEFFVAGYLGTMHAGCCAVPLPIDCAEKTFERLATSTGMKAILVGAQIYPRIRDWLARFPIEVVVESPDCFAGGAEALPAVQVDLARHLASIMSTSGSTGEVKGVMVTHRNILTNTEDILSYVGLCESDRGMVVLPFHYCYGTSLLHTHVMAGASLVLNNRFMFPEKVLDELEQTECTGLAGVPATYQILLRKTRFAKRKFPALRWLQQAGGKLPTPLISEIRQAFPDVKFFVMYGQTEATARLSYLPPEQLGDKLGSIGRGLPHTQLEVLRSDGQPVVPGSEETGEIVASGDNITQGYWNDPEETSLHFRDGKLYTGDMARVDADGFIFVVERARDFIKAMGYRVAPQEVEEVLATMPEVVESAAVGVPDDVWGEAIKAFVVTVQPDQLTADDVRSYCLNRLPNYKVPQHVEFVSSLPKLGNGKLDRTSLKTAARAAAAESEPERHGD